MMRRLLLAVMLNFMALAPVLAAAKADPLGDFKKRFASPAFGESRLTGNGHLMLQAKDPFFKASSGRQGTLVREAVDAWRGSLSAAGYQSDPLFVQVVGAASGSLWRFENGKLLRLDDWAADNLPYVEQSGVGRLFGFFGAQMTTGDAKSKGLNARLGSTLFQNKYDFALSLGYLSVDAAQSLNIKSFGMVGRKLIPYSKEYGFNVGAQVQRTDVEGTATNTLAAVGGVNFYVPGGSFDVTLTLGNNSAYSLLAGYTFFFDRK